MTPVSVCQMALWDICQIFTNMLEAKNVIPDGAEFLQSLLVFILKNVSDLGKVFHPHIRFIGNFYFI